MHLLLMLSVGIFANHGDVGKPSTIGPGSVIYDAATGTYTVTGGGENMWGTADHFHYVWIKVSGDVTLESMPPDMATG
jgi:TolB protein